MEKYTNILVALLLTCVSANAVIYEISEDFLVQGDSTFNGNVNILGSLTAATESESRHEMDEIALGSESVISAWSDLDTVIDLFNGYVNAISHPSDPGAAFFTIGSKSGKTVTFPKVFGSGGITVLSTGGNLEITGSATSGVEVVFAPPASITNGAIYYRQRATGHNWQTLLLEDTASNQVMVWQGTAGFTMGNAGASTNADNLGNQPVAYWLNSANSTNFRLYDDGVLNSSAAFILDAGDNIDIETTNVIYNGVTQTVYKLNAGSISGGSLNTSNLWTEYNNWEDRAYFWEGIELAGRQSSMSGAFASIGVGGTNIDATGEASTAAGGRDVTASGIESTAGGGDSITASGDQSVVDGGQNNVASAKGSVVGGGRGNTASDNYATVNGGFGNQATEEGATVLGGQYVFVSGSHSIAGGHSLDLTHDYSYMFGRGQASTNKLQSMADYTFVIMSGVTSETYKVGINTNDPQAELHVVGTIMANAFVDSIGNPIAGGDGAWVQDTNTLDIYILTNAVGIGIAAPTNPLHVVGMAQFQTAIVQQITFDDGTTQTTASAGSGAGTFTNINIGASNYTTEISLAFDSTQFKVAYTGIVAYYEYTGAVVSVEADNIFTNWLATNTFVQTEVDPNHASWLSTNTYVQTEVDALWTAVSNNVLFSSGTTGEVVFANVVQGPTPTNSADLATKGYVDTASSAAVTNAVDQISLDGSTETGLSAIEFVNAVSLSQAGSTGIVTLADNPVFFIQGGGGGSLLHTNADNSADGLQAAVLYGIGNEATNRHSMAGGYSNSAYGIFSVAMGDRNQAGGNNDIVLGTLNTSSRGSAGGNALFGFTQAAAGGFRNFAAGGDHNFDASTDFAGATGDDNNFFSGDSSFAAGKENTIRATAVGILGYANQADGNYSIALGNNNDSVPGTLTAIMLGAYHKVQNALSDYNSLLGPYGSTVDGHATFNAIVGGYSGLTNASHTMLVGHEVMAARVTNSIVIGHRSYIEDSKGSFIVGTSNLISDADGAMVLGKQGTVTHDNTFMWNGSGSAKSSRAANTVEIHAPGGVYLEGPMRSMVMGEVYIPHTNSIATTITNAGQWFVVQGVAHQAAVAMNLDLGGAQTNGFVATNAVPMMGHMGATISYNCGSANQVFDFAAMRNGIDILPASVTQVEFKNAGQVQSTALHFMAPNIGTNDYFELCVRNNTGTADVSVTNLNLFVMGM